MLVLDKIIMRSDPIYLFQKLTWKASLGVLSVAGNVCRVIISEMSNNCISPQHMALFMIFY